MNKKILLIFTFSLIFSVKGSEQQVSKRRKATTEEVRLMDISPFDKIAIPELITNITQYLKPVDIAHLAQVNRRLNAIAPRAMTELNFTKKNSIDQITATLARYAGPQLKKLIINDINLGNFDWGFLEKCRNLETLVLHNCGLTQFIPGIVSLTKLKKLDLSQNKLSGVQNWDIIPECLQELDLCDCSLKLTALPVRFASLRKLKKLNLAVNDLFEVENWDILSDILEELYLYECKLMLEKLPDRIETLNRLKELSISGNNLSQVGNWDILPEFLEDLDIGACELILMELPKRIGSLTQLKKLDLAYNNLSHVENWDIFPESLEELGLYADDLVLEQLPARIAFLGRLKALYMQDNDLSQVQNWDILNNLMQLRELDIQNTGVNEKPDLLPEILVRFGEDENGQEENNDDNE